MHDDVNQKISQLLDNELDQTEALSILQKIQLQPDLKNKKDRYEAIGHVLKTEVFLFPNPDFASRISKQVQNEPFYLLPRNTNTTETKTIKRNYKTLALAASITAVAFVTLNELKTPENKLKTVPTLQIAQQRIDHNPPSVHSPSPEQKDSIPINARISDYLQAHNGNIYTVGEAGFRPFAKVSAASQE